MKLKPIASNMNELEVGDFTILVSYETPVAYHEAGKGFFRTSKKWSNTTSRHINKWLALRGSGYAAEVEQDVLNNLFHARINA